jgi:transposase
MHEAALEELGGVPEEILYGRMKTIWTGVDERGEIIWNAAFEDFTRYWGFQPRLCRPYRAQTKGKIESGVKYVRRNFLCGLLGREPGNLADRKSERTCGRSSDVRPIRTAARRSAKWHGTPTCRGRAAATRCHGSMPAGQCG